MEHRRHFQRVADFLRSACATIGAGGLLRPILVAVAFGVVSARASSLIAEDRIAELEQELHQAEAPGGSAVSARRVLKNAARKGLALVEEAPDAPNRFRVLGVVFRCQQRLLAQSNIEEYRNALFETCERLSHAPDEYAELRLEADLLLSEKALSERNATLQERAQALEELLERYRGTAAEARSLLMAALIVQKLEAPQLEGEILQALDDRYPDDHEVIEFRRRHLRATRLDLVFSGTFRRHDGVTLVFPADIMGHESLMVFWSAHTPGAEDYLKKAGQQLTPLADRIHVFSFNVDDLPDGGASILREQGLDWTVLQLSGGRNHQAYRTYARGEPASVLVNAFGASVLRAEIVHGRTAALDMGRISDQRFLAQLQSLFIGDMLVGGDQDDPIPSDLRDVFVEPPFRYRLTKAEALAMYGKAAERSADLMRTSLPEPELRAVRARRIIALLGLWNLGCEPRHLEEAVREARAALAAQPPVGAEVVPRFCLAKAALRTGEADAAAVVSDFLRDCGGEDAPASALAAAGILTMAARSRELYEDHRARFLERHAASPAVHLWASFLRDRYHQFRVLRPNYTRQETGSRGHIVGHGLPPSTDALPDIELRNLDGSTLRLPEGTRGKLTYLLFVEPPEDPAHDFPFVLDGRGQPTRSDAVRSVMGFAEALTRSHVNGDIEFVAAFLTDDAAHVSRLMEANGWTCRAVMVPGGLRNPMVRQLGVLSADHIPNVFLLRRDGTIAWSASGLRYQHEFGFPFAFLLAMKVHVEVCEMETGTAALQRGDYREAARVFSGPFLPSEPDRYGWRAPQFHGKTLANMGLGEWNQALEDIDVAILAHKRMHYRGRGPRRPEDWSTVLAEFTVDPPCDVLAELWDTKAAILDQLDRAPEAAEWRRRAAGPIRADPPNIYKVSHERLKALRAEKRRR